jgi:uncharacterized protein (DUF885 family)
VIKRDRVLHIAAACLLIAGQPASSGLLPDAISAPLRNAGVGSLESVEKSFAALVDKYFESTFKYNPNQGTSLGFHQYDSLAPDLSATARAAQIAELKSFEKEFGKVKPDELGKQSRIDLELINANIKARLLELEEIRTWEKNPDIYSAAANTMIYELMKRDFAPLAERLRSAIAREKNIKGMLASGVANVKNPPRIYTQIALEQMPGMVGFFQNSVPECFKDVKDAKLQDEFRAVNLEVVKEMKDYQAYLKNELLSKSNGSFVLGEDFYSRKLLYEQMVDTPISRLLQTGYDELRRVQKEFARTASEIDAGKTPAEVITAVSCDHPAPERLLADTSAVLQQLKDFCINKNILTIPPENNLHVAETPPFERALSFASMDAPGTFETKATEAYYYVTLPEPDWTPQRREEHMRAYSRYDLLNTSDHEAYPGHYVQGLRQRNAPSKTTKIINCGSNSEGWAHYCEQMMVEAGLANYDKKLKLIMLHDALLRCCRYIVGISMHTRGMTVDEGIAFFMKEGYQERANAERETKRGTVSPTYLIYTLGKLQILALKDDYKKLRGADFTLKDFHDRFLSTGRPPVKIIREIMLGPDNAARMEESLDKSGH